MWEGLLGSIRQIGVFMICAQALIYFKPKGSYEKYLKLLVSAMILVQLLSPVAALLSGKEGQSLEERIAFYSSSFEQGMGEAALEEYRVEQIRQQLLTAQIKAQMEAWNWQPESSQTMTAEESSSREEVWGTAGLDNQGENRMGTERDSPEESRRETGQDSWENGDGVRIQIGPVTVGSS